MPFRINLRTFRRSLLSRGSRDDVVGFLCLRSAQVREFPHRMHVSLEVLGPQGRVEQAVVVAVVVVVVVVVVVAVVAVVVVVAVVEVVVVVVVEGGWFG